MSIETSEKLKLIRESERMNRKQFAELTGIPYGTLSGYETLGKEIGFTAIQKIFSQPRFRKYHSWFMFDEVSPEAGQIAPVLAHVGQDGSALPPSDLKTG
ncbi:MULTISPECIES: helix-turn-helix domain-containing protein [Aeromonas]|uniref:helix-turn-helix domain-containing protein n=1 Tax=Aeromonas TaxID=642 RepID=UPI0005AA858A|nr:MULTISPECIES: helix-turn-helix transcriptional regulator [Aeromonas]TNI18329.1 transcriptional regulator [Aeromonas dhakensis]